MKNYLLFDDPAEVSLLAGVHYSELALSISEVRNELYLHRGRMWEAFLQHCQQSKIPLIIFINGCSNAGKSSWSLEVAHRLGIRNMIHTDTIRNVLRHIFDKDPNAAVHYPTYQCWKTCAEKYSPEALIEGFREQSRAILPYVEALMEEAVDSGKFTLIEGMHLIPSLMDSQSLKSSHLLRFFLSVDSPALQDQRLIRRSKSTYLNRHPAKYEPYADAFEVLRNYLAEEAQKASVITVHNKEATETLDQVMSVIDEKICGILY